MLNNVISNKYVVTVIITENNMYSVNRMYELVHAYACQL